MIKDIITSNENVTPNNREIEILKENFPSCFRPDGSFDIIRFKEYLGDKVSVSQEGYELRFLGKSYAKMLAALDTETVIVPDEEHNSKPENRNSQNVYISGDNLDGLKHLLKSYARQVKCIYIDPPYNTGKDEFAYNDTFLFKTEDLVSKLSIDEEQASRIIAMTSRGSSSHSAWLTFIYPRLLLARDLLRKDGVIFISIDDNEQANLKLIMNDIFGEDNFLGTITWNNATDNNPTRIAIEHEYVLCYAKDHDTLEPVWKSNISEVKKILIDIGKKLSLQYENEDDFQKAWKNWYRAHKDQLSPLDRYKYIDRDGVYTGSQSVHNPGREGYRYDIIHPVTGKPCVQPLMGYRFPESTMQSMLSEGRILFGEDENKIIELKVYAKEYKEKFSSIYELDGRLGAYDIKALFPEAKQIFKNPKPVQLIEHILSFVLSEDDIFVDFFSGSGTSAEAFFKYCAASKINATCIQIQLKEEVKSGSEAEKLGYKTIDEIGIERIIRSIRKLSDDDQSHKGFKHYTLQNVSAQTLDKLQIFDNSGFITDKTVFDLFGTDTVLSTWLIHDGYTFTNKCQKIDLESYMAYWCENHLYLINPGMDEGAVKALIDRYNSDGSFNPQNIVVFGYSFNFVNMENLKTNVKILRDSEKNLKVNLDIRY